VLERERLSGRLFLLSALCEVLRWRRESVCSAILGLAHAEGSSEVALVDEAVEHTLLELERAIAEHSMSRNEATGMDIDTPPAQCAVSSGPAKARAATASCFQTGTAEAPTAAAAQTASSAFTRTRQEQQQQQSYQQYLCFDRRLHQQISPPDDPLALFKHLFLQPLWPAGVENMSLQQLLVVYGSLVRELSAVLQLHEQGSGHQQEARLQELAFRWGCSPQCVLLLPAFW
jgi:MarR-like DNA-binding transcriptional regulator SgrR of sgrS sRNA